MKDEIQVVLKQRLDLNNQIKALNRKIAYNMLWSYEAYLNIPGRKSHEEEDLRLCIKVTPSLTENFIVFLNKGSDKIGVGDTLVSALINFSHAIHNWANEADNSDFDWLVENLPPFLQEVIIGLETNTLAIKNGALICLGA